MLLESAPLLSHATQRFLGPNLLWLLSFAGVRWLRMQEQEQVLVLVLPLQ
jgi:hypothetical protein